VEIWNLKFQNVWKLVTKVLTNDPTQIKPKSMES